MGLIYTYMYDELIRSCTSGGFEMTKLVTITDELIGDQNNNLHSVHQ